MIIALGLRRHGTLAAAVSILTALAMWGLLAYGVHSWDGALLKASLTWFELGILEVQMGLQLDHLAAAMGMVVVLTAFWIHCFSLGYLRGDPSKARFFGGLSLFMFAMLGIVFADNLWMLFIFWELVGFSSYLLIAHYWETPEAREAAKKAFIVNRVGDVGFLIGIIACWGYFGTTDLSTLQTLSKTIEPTTLLGLLLICGFLGKSAQFPLHVWLPDAMAGPTPASALIHAATMVAAGVYLLCRIFFLLTPEVLITITVLGVAMALYAGSCALAQRDIKKILAYSTLAQLGYMASAIGLGYPGLAFFHLTTHAFFKALLFLGAGSVIYACHHEQNIFKMGGLLRRMPITGLTFAIGMLALCGVPLTSGYFSKDAILAAAFLNSPLLFALLLVAAFLTALYMGRLFFVAFLGTGPKHSSSHQPQVVRESPLVMTLPLIVLSVLALCSGFIGTWPAILQDTVSPALSTLNMEEGYSAAHKAVLIGGSLSWGLGLILAGIFYRNGTQEDPITKHAPRLYRLLASRLYFDEIYNAGIVRTQDRLARGLHFLDLALLSGILARGSSWIVHLVGVLCRKLHTGSLPTYAYWFFGGLILFAAFIVM